MKLADWIEVKGLKSKWVAAQLRVSPTTLSMYCTEQRVPRPDVMRRIIQLTDGHVEPNDFFDIRALRAVAAGVDAPDTQGAAA